MPIAEAYHLLLGDKLLHIVIVYFVQPKSDACPIYKYRFIRIYRAAATSPRHSWSRYLCKTIDLLAGALSFCFVMHRDFRCYYTLNSTGIKVNDNSDLLRSLPIFRMKWRLRRRRSYFMRATIAPTGYPKLTNCNEKITSVTLPGENLSPFQSFRSF